MSLGAGLHLHTQQWLQLTTSRPRTVPRREPYLRNRRPPALVAKLPPMWQLPFAPRSRGMMKSRSSTYRFSSSKMHPAWHTRIPAEQAELPWCSQHRLRQSLRCELLPPPRSSHLAIQPRTQKRSLCPIPPQEVISVSTVKKRKTHKAKMRRNTCTHIHLHTFTCMCVLFMHMCTCTHVPMDTCMHMYSCIHAYTQPYEREQKREGC